MKYINNSCNISDYFANEKDMYYISDIYVKLVDYFVINNFNYVPLLNHYLRHKIGEIIYYIDILKKHKTVNVFKYKDKTMFNVYYLLNKKSLLEDSKIKSKKNSFIAYFFLNYFIGKFNKVLFRLKRKKTAILTSKRFWDSKRHQDIEFGDLFEKQNDYSYIMINESLHYKDILFHYKLMLSEPNLLFLEREYSFNTLLKSLEDVEMLKNHWNALKQNPKFKNIFVYKNINYFQLMNSFFEEFLNSSAYYVCLLKNNILKINKEYSFENVLMSNEYNTYAKLFILLSNDKYKTISLSHEIVYPGSIYAFRNNNKIKNQNNLRPLPDMKLVWNKYSKDILIKKGNYPEDKIVVVGNPKFDKIVKYKQDNNKSKYNGIFLFVSEPREESKRFLIDILKENKDISVWYKTRNLSDEYEIKKITKSFNFKNLKIIKYDEDIYKLINKVDVVIATVSTILIEAMLLNKNILLFDPNIKLPDMPYISENLLKRIKNKEEFRREINKLKNRVYREKERFKYASFIKRYYPLEISKDKIIKELKKAL